MNYFKLLRLQRGLTQSELAKLMDIHEVTICRVENGWFARPPTGFDEGIKRVFGPEWSWPRLMEKVPEVAAKEAQS